MKSIRLLIVFIGYILIRESSGVTLDAAPEEFKKFMKDLNEGRRQLAKNENISNMHELTWNSSLQVAVSSKTSDELNNSSEWYLWVSLKKDITFKCNLLPGECVTRGPPRSISERFPFFYPLHTTITCAERPCTEPCIVCLFGRKQNPFDIIDGPPGTNCSDGFKNNNNGLCSAEKQKDPTVYIPSSSGSEATLQPALKKFIVDLNMKRRDLAKNQSIANMHELSWNKGLQVKVNKLPIKELWDNWSFVPMETLRINKSLEQMVKDCIRGNLVACNEYHPNETIIACTSRKFDEKLKFVCLVGEGAGKGGDVLINGKPGTKCRDGFKNNNDGLCSDKVPPTTEAPKVPSTVTEPSKPADPKPPTSSEPVVKLDPEHLVRHFNDVRRKFAREQNYSNMHELTWDIKIQETIQETLKSLEPDEWDDLTSKWFVAWFHEPVEKFTEDYKRCIDPNGINCAYVFPRQKTIGCGRHPTHIVCFFGPAQLSTEFTYGTPGTDCDEGFKINHNGLCSLNEASTTAPSNPKPTKPSESQVSPAAPAPEVLTSSKAPAAPTRKPPPLITRPVPTLPAELRDYVEMDGDEYDDDFPTDSPNKTSGRSFGFFFLLLIMVVLKV